MPRKVSEVCEVCEVEAIIAREISSEPDRLCGEEKMFVFVIVMTIQFAILWVYSFYSIRRVNGITSKFTA